MEKDSMFNEKKLSYGAYLSLLFAIIFFSGLLLGAKELPWLSAFDFTTVNGSFGTMKEPAKNTFMGAGGKGARDGFMFAFSLIPTIMFALGVLEILTAYGAMAAAQKLLSPLLRFLIGAPGLTALVLITDLQNTDTGAVLTKQLYDEGAINEKERVLIASWQYSAAGTLTNYFAIASAFFGMILVPVIVPLAIILVMKFVGANLVRICLKTFYKGDFIHDKP